MQTVEALEFTGRMSIRRDSTETETSHVAFLDPVEDFDLPTRQPITRQQSLNLPQASSPYKPMHESRRMSNRQNGNQSDASVRSLLPSDHLIGAESNFELQEDGYEVVFGVGHLGIEFVASASGANVVVRSAETTGAVERGMVVEAINGCEVQDMAAIDILEMLQEASRPLSLRFRRHLRPKVICKLCERRVDAETLEDHTNYCVLSTRLALETDEVDGALMNVAESVDEAIGSDLVQRAQDQRLFANVKEIAMQAAACDASCFESLTLCSGLIKVVDSLRQKDVDEDAVVERAIKLLATLRNCIHAKMSKMRATQKVLLQATPPPERHAIHRTRSLEEMDDPPCPTRHTRRRSSAFRASIQDFEVMKPISKGAFGKVYLARKKTTGDQYAIKVLAKEHLVRKKQVRQIETERNILMRVESPFVVKLFWTFQSKHNLFLVMEYLPGGDFMSLMECIVQLDEDLAQVYIAQIAVALRHLHSKGCVHRDLKPDNVLISTSGHIKLTDFGLSEEGVGLPDSNVDVQQAADVCRRSNQEQNVLDAMSFQERVEKRATMYSHTNGHCGTPDYLSPEIVLGQAHGPEVDYWALGVMLYEMLVGFPPFNDETVQKIFGNILEQNIIWPDGDKCLSPEAMDAIERLLDPNPRTRMGWKELKEHTFFKGIDWNHLFQEVPPFVPSLEGPQDTSYFNNRDLTEDFIDDVEQVEQVPMSEISPCKFPSGMYNSTVDTQESASFHNFSYTNMSALAAASMSEAETQMADVEEDASFCIWL